MDARIGKLIRNGQTIFYAFTEGYGKEPFEGTLEAVEIALGLRMAPVENKAPVEPLRKPKRTLDNLKTYAVTVTPKYKTYGGSFESGPYTVDVVAWDRNEAIKQAREEYNNNAGFLGDVATYTARVKK